MHTMDDARAVTSADVKARAAELGFDLCGIAPAAALPELGFLREWLARGYAGEMHYLHRTAERRADVRAVMPSARSVISLGDGLQHRPSVLDRERRPGRAAIARYAWGDDYHEVIGERLDALVGTLRAAAGEPFEARAYVDTGPVQERVYAQYAGLGWIGKNTCVINPELGSWLFLSEIITSLALEPDAPGSRSVRDVPLCLDACPTGAIVEPRVLDATRCLSYLTIELKGRSRSSTATRSREHAYGCDVCQEVCPWNRRRPGRHGAARLAAARRARRSGAARFVADIGRRAARVAEGQRDDARGGHAAAPQPRGRVGKAATARRRPRCSTTTIRPVTTRSSPSTCTGPWRASWLMKKRVVL